eukprot:CAMPEP_0182486916 /NCGR_PEP_ID=MMETSP1319-20130603/47638_1 /TAXON_ID=172717 /ORGANISM="Bolidomonas pacifica, Strain RCC208" /LENGTH=41 /DNA_ID= /DNA_START= /DNA_END= /DNA_ORIENTATION=
MTSPSAGMLPLRAPYLGPRADKAGATPAQGQTIVLGQSVLV